MFARLLKHLSRYSLGSLLVMAAGLVSFPVFTRVFDPAQYGVMSLVSSTLVALTVVAKLGLQTSLLRMHAEVTTPKAVHTERQLVATAVWGVAGCATLVVLGALAFTQWMPANRWSMEAMPGLLLIAVWLVGVRSLDSLLINLLQARQLSGRLATYNVLRRWGVLATCVAAVLWWSADLRTFFAATLAAEVLATAAMAWWLLRQVRPTPGQISLPLGRSMLGYGLPLMLYELSSVVLNLGDRYVIEWVMGAQALGIYSASYNLCEYLYIVLAMATNQAVAPMYNRLWEEKGPQATADFLREVLFGYAVVAVAVVGATSVAGAPVLGLLATERYVAGPMLMTLVMAGLLVEGAHPIIAAGLYLAKRTRLLMGLMFGCAGLTLALNLLLVPRYGLIGAAVAVVLSNAAFTLATTYFARPVLPVQLAWSRLGLAVLAGIAAWSLSALLPHSHLGWVALRLAVFLPAYLLLLLALDRRSRVMLIEFYRRRQQRPGSNPTSSSDH